MFILTCQEVDKNLVFYLDQALPARKRLLIEQHLAGCTACRERLAATAAAQAGAARALQSLAENAQPSAQAWDVLQNRLAREAQIAPAGKEKVWNARKAPRAGRTSIIHTLLGVTAMKNRTLLSTIAALAVLAAAGIFLMQPAAPVSARQIIEKAYQASSEPQAAEGIRHMRLENYTNPQMMSPGNWAEKISSESYNDLTTGIYRSVRRDASTGELLNASAYDGSFMYTNRSAESLERRSGPLTIYRTPQSLEKITGLMNSQGSQVDAKAMFENMKAQADVVAVSQETRPDGRAVYKLVTSLPQEAGSKFGIEGLSGESIVVVDAETYELLESSLVTKGEDGQDTLLNSYSVLENEILPAGSPVAWDLSDVEGITFVDDPTREFGDLLPEKITPEELLQHTASAYLLKSIPEGFELELSAPPVQKNEPQYVWLARYFNAGGDYFLLQSGGEIPASVMAAATDIYETQAGLTLRIEVYDQDLPEGMKPQLAAYASGPEGAQFIISSNLPRERAVELAEQLELVK